MALARRKSYALIYKYVQGMAEKRIPYRNNHLEYAKLAEGKGLLLGGALQDPIDTGILLFEAEESFVKDYAANDPYTTNGLVESFSIREIIFAGGSIKPK